MTTARVEVLSDGRVSRGQVLDGGARKTARVLVLSGHHDQMDRRIVSETNALAESGRSVTLVSVPAEVSLAWLHPKVRLVMAPHQKARRKPWLRQLAVSVASHVPAVLETLRGWLRPSRMKARSQSLIDLTPDSGYDVIHCHDLDTLPAGQLIRSRLAPRAKLIYDSHEFYPYQQRERSFCRYWAAVEQQHIHLADLVITVNESIAEQLRARYRIARPAVIYNSYGSPSEPPALSAEDFARHFGAPEAGFRVLFQGSFSPLRNLTNLVKAFGLLGDSFQLFLLGRGPLEGDLRNLCARAGLRNVFFGEHVAQEHLLGFTHHADLGVIPYEDGGLLNMRYCTPNKLFEYIEACVPICASDLPELVRIVEGGGIGKAYPMRSAEEIARAIRDCRERVEHGEFHAGTLERLRQRFAWSHQRERLLTLYDQLGV